MYIYYIYKDWSISKWWSIFAKLCQSAQDAEIWSLYNPEHRRTISHYHWLVVGPPLWKIWKSIGMMTFPIFLGKCQKWQPNHQPDQLDRKKVCFSRVKYFKFEQRAAGDNEAPNMQRKHWCKKLKLKWFMVVFDQWRGGDKIRNTYFCSFQWPFQSFDVDWSSIKRSTDRPSLKSWNHQPTIIDRFYSPRVVPPCCVCCFLTPSKLI